MIRAYTAPNIIGKSAYASDRWKTIEYGVGVSIFRVGDQGIDEEIVYWDTLLMLGSRTNAVAAYSA